MKRTIWALLTILIAASLTLPACGPAPGTPTPTGPVKIAFWHSMGAGLGGKGMEELVKRFNESQKNVVVEATFQGSYDDSLNKLKAGLQSGDVPAVVQLFDIASRLMIDLDVVVPIQNFIDKEKYVISDFETNVLAYYTVGNKLYSMPFNTSNPMLYYNKDLFKAAGLDPNKPPRTFDEVRDYARKLTKKDASGKVTQYGIAIAAYGWFFEQLLAVSGGEYVNNGNGRDARATKATFNSPQGVKVLEWWKGMYDEGVCANFGRKTADTQKAFDAQQTAMFIDSTAVLRSRLDASKGKFELGTGFLPRPTEEEYKKFGTIIGGASNWILKARPEREQKAAWEFIKFMSSPESQAYWHTMSGYYPIRKSAYDLPMDKEWRAQFPQFQTAIDQLHLAPNNRVTQGGLIGVFPQARQTIEAAIEEVLLGKAAPKEALDKAAASVTDAIDNYNKTVPAKK
ncbi:MAG: ABC transporter substrate-binding protein [Chloroflexota bacterium]